MTQFSFFCFGLGYCGQALAARLLAQGWRVGGTCRGADARDRLAARGVTAHLFDGAAPLPDGALAGVTHILGSIPPDDGGDPALRHHAAQIAALRPAWVGYLSTTGVYGDHRGGWVDEDTPVTPMTGRGHRRARAEAQWRRLGAHIFRLAGIYGPGRCALDEVRAGRARRIVKPGHVFSRIHVDDIANVVMASMARPRPGAVYNVCDDEAAPPQDVTAFACALLGVAPPPEIPLDMAELSPMAASFYGETKRIRNDRIKDELGVKLAYPDYRDGLRAILVGDNQGAKRSS